MSIPTQVTAVALEMHTRTQQLCTTKLTHTGRAGVLPAGEEVHARARRSCPARVAGARVARGESRRFAASALTVSSPLRRVRAAGTSASATYTECDTLGRCVFCGVDACGLEHTDGSDGA